MKFIECVQGSDEWQAARTGVITASKFRDAIQKVGQLDDRQSIYVQSIRGGASEQDAMVMAGYKAKPKASAIDRALSGLSVGTWSDGSKAYAAQIAVERVSGTPSDEGFNSWQMRRGQEQEPFARIAYEEKTGNLASESGVVLTDDGKFGYSTDGSIDDDGELEIKCLASAPAIIEMWRDGDMSEYMHQMQGGMWITGRQWCDFVMYCPQLAPVGKELFCRRVQRDDAFIEKMVADLIEFEQMASEYEAILRT